jgi:hypothetical protein
LPPPLLIMEKKELQTRDGRPADFSMDSVSECQSHLRYAGHRNLETPKIAQGASFS